jgi:alpha-L-fucosidase 2
MNYTFSFDAPPRYVPTDDMPDGPLLGNGDVGAVLGGPPEKQVFYIAKNDIGIGPAAIRISSRWVKSS